MQNFLTMDPNCFARIKSEEILDRFKIHSKGVTAWILTCNFFFGVLPGILFFVTNIRLSQEETKSLPNLLPDFNRAVSWFGIIFVLFPICISVFQMFHFHRLISLRFTRSFFVGQFVGFIFYMCSFSKSFLEKFHWFPRRFTILALILILIGITMILLFLPYLFLFSELVYVGRTICNKKEQQQLQSIHNNILPFLCKQNMLKLKQTQQKATSIMKLPQTKLQKTVKAYKPQQGQKQIPTEIRHQDIITQQQQKIPIAEQVRFAG